MGVKPTEKLFSHVKEKRPHNIPYRAFDYAEKLDKDMEQALNGDDVGVTLSFISSLEPYVDVDTDKNQRRKILQRLGVFRGELLKDKRHPNQS